MSGEPALPSGPAGAFGNSSDSYDRRRPGRFAEQSHGPVVIDQTRLPTSAPFTAFVGNLPFDISENDLRTFFQMRDIPANAIVNISLPRDPENKSRGFGYMEFASVEDLTRALMASNQHQIRNRVIRVDFSESKQRSEREVHPAESNRNWRDGATSTASTFGAREVREPRPVSVAESNMNWRDGPRTVTPAATPAQPQSQAPKIRTQVPQEPMPNWRESSRPVEAVVRPSAPAKTEAKAPAAKPPVESKVPTGSWRR
jgi:RNA recognition motif-containing protein